MSEDTERRNSNNQLLQELEALSQSLYQSHTTRRTASLALPRSAASPIPIDGSASARQNAPEEKPQQRHRFRRMSLSPWRSRSKLDDTEPHTDLKPTRKLEAAESEKKGIWNWKPIRAISHIGMQRLSCLFSVEVVSVQGLPASMNGLRLSVCVRKKENKNGVVQTMPARVIQGAADFEETLFIRCHLYCTASGKGNHHHLKFEPRPFLIYVVAVDAEKINFGKSSVDLSMLVQESMEKNLEGTRIRQWDMSFDLSGKAKGGELVLKLGFQIMEDKGVGIYNQGDNSKSSKGKDPSASPFARKQSKASFSVTSPRITSKFEASTPSQTAAELQGIDDLNLDEPAPAPVPIPSTVAPVQKPEAEAKVEDLDIPDFDVVDKGIELEDKGSATEAELEERSVSSEVVKEVVHDPVHLTRLTELDSIAQQIKALESMISHEDVKTEQETEFHRLDAEEETVTREFLQLLEEEELNLDMPDVPPLKLDGMEELEEAEAKGFLPDLGKGLGSVVQTRDGGYLAAMNPFGTEVLRKEMPKIAMQISKPLILPLKNSASGFEVFQKIAAMGVEELASEVLSATAMDELIGKTAEQIAFEGVASAIIHGRNKEGATSSAARSIAAVRNMVTAMSMGRKERISTGIWNVREEPVRLEEVLAFSLQKIEIMAIEALKIQAEITEEEAPFDVSPLLGKTGGKDADHLLASAVSLEEWMKNSGLASKEEPRTLTLLVVVQLRDPLRRYEAVGSPVIALIQATCVDAANIQEEERCKVASLHIGGLKVRAGGKRHAWDAEKQRLTAMQWLLAYGLVKAAKKGKNMQMKGQDSLWSISARVMADMWLKPIRNPNVKFHK